MLTLLLLAGSLVTFPQNREAAPAVSPACSVLSAQEVASLIGPTKAMAGAGTSTVCMFQNGAKSVSVLLVTLGTNAAATGQWQGKKSQSAGQDVTGWSTPAYSSAVETARQHAAIVGLVKGRTFLEVRVVDATQKAADLKTRLEAVMKPVSGRLP